MLPSFSRVMMLTVTSLQKQRPLSVFKSHSHSFFLERKRSNLCVQEMGVKPPTQMEKETNLFSLSHCRLLYLHSFFTHSSLEIPSINEGRRRREEKRWRNESIECKSFHCFCICHHHHPFLSSPVFEQNRITFSLLKAMTCCWRDKLQQRDTEQRKTRRR